MGWIDSRRRPSSSNVFQDLHLSSVCGSMGVTVLQKEIIIITTRNATLCKGDLPRSCIESCCDKGGMPCGVKFGQGENRPPSISNADHVQQIGRPIIRPIIQLIVRPIIRLMIRPIIRPRIRLLLHDREIDREIPNEVARPIS